MTKNVAIHVHQLDNSPSPTYRVSLAENNTETNYTVSVTSNYYQHLTGGVVSPEKLLKLSFRFLLEKEPKEAILSQFELGIIKHYFPDYEKRIHNMLSETNSE